MLVGDAYSGIYLERMASMLERNLNVPYRLHCITDSPRAMPKGVTEIDGRGWSDVRRAGMKPTTMKLRLFDPKSLPFKDFLYLDLTLVIQKNLQSLLEFCDSRPENLIIVRDWNYDGYNSCVMRVRHSPELESIYRAFADGKTFDQRNLGDQDFIHNWIQEQNLENEVGFFEPDHVASYRNLQHLNWTDPKSAEAAIGRATIVKFYGRVKMHDVLNPLTNFSKIRMRYLRTGGKDARFWVKELRSLWR